MKRFLSLLLLLVLLARGAAAATITDGGPATWTPADGSGAGLTFTSVTAYYQRILNVCVINFVLVYPATIDVSAAKLSGLPCTAINQAAPFTGAVFTTVANATVARVAGNVAVMDFFNATGVAATNANLSGVTIRVSIVIIAQ